jgi:rhamnogalacturonyl hydrolase YesR
MTATSADIRDKVANSLLQVQRWVEDHHYRGYEPFDGLSSLFRPLTFGNLLLDRLLLQLIRQSPINLRPMFGVRPLDSTKGRGYMAAGYLTMAKLTGETAYSEKAVNCLEWLIDHKSPKFQQYTWANHFDFASRGGAYSRHESIIVWTALIGFAFLDAYEQLKDERFLQVASSACDWILALPRERTAAGTCISYHALNQSSIHNANMLGAAMLARTATFTKCEAALTLAGEAMTYSCSRQLPNGAWYYAEAPHYHWIDNFHTGYNLDSLRTYIDCTGDTRYERQLQKGFDFFCDHFIEADGRPKYYHDRAYPIDSQCMAQAIDTLANFANRDDRALPLAVKAANWGIDHMQGADGHFYYRQYPLIKARTPMLHWAQATMYRALTLLLAQLDNPTRR